MNIASVLGVISGLSWMLVIAVVVVSVLRTSRGGSARGSTPLIISTIVLALILTTLSQGLVFVEPERRGVVISALPGQAGIRETPLQGGLNWIVPYFETVITYPISRQTYTMSSSSDEGQIAGDDSIQARTKDGQIVFVDASVIFQIDPREVVNVHVSWQSNYINDLVRPQARGIIRDAVAVYNIEDVYSSKRAEVTTAIQDEMTAILAEEGFTLIDFVLRNISFSSEYAASVEQKQIAEQEALRAEFVVQQREQEAEQARAVAQGAADADAIRAEGSGRARVIQAQAEAEARLIQAQAEAQALQLLGEALQDNPDVLTLEYIQKLAPNISVMLLPSDNPFLFPLPEIGPPAPTTTPTAVPTPLPTVEPTPTETSP